jgi:hypothetical protein
MEKCPTLWVVMNGLALWPFGCKWWGIPYCIYVELTRYICTAAQATHHDLKGQQFYDDSIES